MAGFQGASYWNCEPESAALAVPAAFRPDRTRMQLDHSSRERQSQAGALEFSARTAFHLLERIKDPRQIPLLNADPRSHFDPRMRLPQI
jgi:hypothetical protein